MEEDQLLKSYFYDLPPELIAQRPADPRDSSRLLVFDEASGTVKHAHFRDLPKFLPPKATLVLNNSRVFPCRLPAKKTTGGKAEIFFLSLKDEGSGHPCLIKTTGKKRVGDQFILTGSHGDISATIKKVNDEGVFTISIDGELSDLIEEQGKVPIPPYIRSGESDAQDLLDYQTLYAREDLEGTGSVAAPTAGLHFTEKVFSDLAVKEILPHHVTLHVGLGTFRPVKVANIMDHKMHEENFYVEESVWQNIMNSNYRVAVGTTSLRVLESLWPTKDLYQGGEMRGTDIFLHPGIKVQSINALMTNFHLPESTLLMLVSALIGREKTLELYEIAVKERYRFFSYGDAMLILRDQRRVV